MKVNLVLSGGAARGVAHIGALKAIEELGLRVKALSGASAGAIVAVFYAYGYSPQEMLTLVKKTRWLSLFRPQIPKRGLFSFKRAERYFTQLIDTERIEDLPKKVYICVTDILSGKPLYLSKGELAPILLGSCALPGIFEPVEYEGKLFIDGGIMNNLPVEPFERYKTPKIGIDVNPLEEVSDCGNIVSLLLRSFFLAVRSNVDKRKELCDLVITPDIASYSPLDIHKADELFALGYRETLRSLRKFLAKYGG